MKKKGNRPGSIEKSFIQSLVVCHHMKHLHSLHMVAQAAVQEVVLVTLAAAQVADMAATEGMRLRRMKPQP